MWDSPADQPIRAGHSLSIDQWEASLGLAAGRWSEDDEMHIPGQSWRHHCYIVQFISCHISSVPAPATNIGHEKVMSTVKLFQMWWDNRFSEIEVIVIMGPGSKPMDHIKRPMNAFMVGLLLIPQYNFNQFYVLWGFYGNSKGWKEM